MQNTRGISWMSFDRSVDVMVSRLRNKLKHKNNKKDQIIKTVHTIGYMFFAEVEE
jgi:DNA-binding response OmpR family regulator